MKRITIAIDDEHDAAIKKLMARAARAAEAAGKAHKPPSQNAVIMAAIDDAVERGDPEPAVTRDAK